MGDRSFLLVVFCKYIIPELSEKTLGARRAGPGRQRRSISGVWRTGAPTPPGHRRTVSFLSFFFNFPHPVRPNPPEPGAEPARRGGRGPHPAKRDSPARVVAAAGRQVREGEAGAARRATRELGGRKGAGPLGSHGGRWPRLSLCGAGCRAATPSTPARATPRAQGASGHRASWAVGVGRARPAPRGSAPPPASARGAGVRGLRPAGARRAPTPTGSGHAPRVRPCGLGAAVWAGRGRALLACVPGFSLPRRAWGLGLSRWVGGVKVPSTARP